MRMELEARVGAKTEDPCLCQDYVYESGSWWNNGLSQTDEWPCVTYFLRNLLSKISKRPINSVHIRDQGHTAAACSKLPMTVTGQTPGVSSFSTVSEHSLRTGASQGSEVGEPGESWGVRQVTGARSLSSLPNKPEASPTC